MAAGLLLLLAAPAGAKSANAQIRAFSAVPAKPFTLLIDGRRAKIAAGAVRTQRRTRLRPGRHVFRARVKHRTVATMRADLAAGDRYTILLVRRGTRYGLQLVREPSPSTDAASLRIANLSPGSGTLAIALGADDTPISTLAYRERSAVIDVPLGVDPSGAVPVRVLRGGRPVATGRLVLAAGSSTTFVILPRPAGTRLVRLPWDAPLPEPLRRPAILGHTAVPETITCDAGSWRGRPTTVIQWTLDGSPVASALDTRLTLTSAVHAGHQIGCEVLATTAGGTVVAEAAGAFDLPSAPLMAAQPSLDGQPLDGAPLTCRRGQYIGDDLVEMVTWLRDGVAVAGQSGDTYTLHATEDEGHPVGCRVVVANDGGSLSVDSPTRTLGAPVLYQAPVIPPGRVVGTTLTASPAVWLASDGTVAEPTRSYQWWRCETPTGGQTILTTPITGANRRSFVITLADIHTSICLRETINQGTYTNFADSGPTAELLPPVPGVSMPTVTATTDTAMTVAGNVNPNGDATTWAFRLGPASGPDYPITSGVFNGGRGTSALPVNWMVAGLSGSTAYHVRLDATNPGGAATSPVRTVYTAPSVGVVSVSVPSPLTVAIGDTATCTPATFTAGGTADVAPTTFAYRWLRGTTVVGTQASYRLAPGDIAATVRCELSASNVSASGGGTTVVLSSNGVTLPPLPTVSGVSIAGTPTVGEPLTASATVGPTGTGTTSYVWQRCTTGPGCVVIGNAVGASYTLGDADATSPGVTIRVVVTQTNGSGTASASATSGVIANTVPGAPSALAITGDPTVGQPLTTVETGTWTGSNNAGPTTVEWSRCSGGSCTPVATGPSYVLQNADAVAAGMTFRVTERRTNATGVPSSVTSPETASIANTPPVGSGLPTISGTKAVGQVLHATDHASWTGTNNGGPTAFQWSRCTPGCDAIPGATGADYTLVDADSIVTNTAMVVSVQRTNATNVSSPSIPSFPYGPIADSPAGVGSAAAITGTASVGQTLTATATFTGSNLTAKHYTWTRCTPSCGTTIGTDTNTYTLVDADAGHTILVTVTQANSHNTATSASPETAVVADNNPTVGSAAAITGTATVGQTLTATATFTGSNLTAKHYAWTRCTPTCSTTIGTDTNTYTLVDADATHTIQVTITQANSANIAASTSPETAVVANTAPTASGAPTVNPATPVVGDTLSASDAVVTWGGSNRLPTTYQWQACTPACADINGATGPTYNVAAGDVTKAFRVVATQANSTGQTASATSLTTAATADSPAAIITGAAISGTPTVGQTLTAAATFSGSNLGALHYAWTRCAPTCSTTVGTDTSSYTLLDADATTSIQVTVTQGNSANTASSTSPESAVVADSTPDVNGTLAIDNVAPGTGSLLTVVDALAWTGSNLSAVAYRWQDCATPGTPASCTDIPLEVGTTYTVAVATGHSVRVLATRTNGAGTAEAASADTAAIP